MDQAKIDEELLAFAWRFRLTGDRAALRDGTPVTILDPGRYNDGPGPKFLNARIEIDGHLFSGSVAVHSRSSDWGYHKHNYDPSYDHTVLNVVREDDRIVKRIDDSVLPAVVLKLPDSLERDFRSLRQGSVDCQCGRFLSSEFTEIVFRNQCDRLIADRIKRKSDELLEIYRATEGSWHETLYVALFRTMGIGKNQGSYVSLARALPYSVVCREKGDVRAIEAMIFGVAGLLDPSRSDEYKEELRELYEELRVKHDLTTLSYSEWTNKGVRPYNFIPKRLAQIAALVNRDDFTFGNLLQYTDIRDIANLFRMELEGYWAKNFGFGIPSETLNRGIGSMTVNILIINMVVPLLFAYGRETGDEGLRERALDLLREIDPEKNRLVVPWMKKGVRVPDAHVSQALIQLSKEYCMRSRCCDCFIGIKVMKKR